MDAIVCVRIVGVVVGAGCAFVQVCVIKGCILTALEASENNRVPHRGIGRAHAVVIRGFNFLAGNGFLIELAAERTYYVVVTCVLFVVENSAGGTLLALSGFQVKQLIFNLADCAVLEVG